MENIYTAALRRAAQAEGSTQALAQMLRVPEGTLLRWMSGRAMMALAAFHRVIDFLAALEACEPNLEVQAHRHTLTFTLHEVSAECTQCGKAQFLAPAPADVLPYTARVLCASCGAGAVHKDLLAQLAREMRFPACVRWRT